MRTYRRKRSAASSASCVASASCVSVAMTGAYRGAKQSSAPRHAWPDDRRDLTAIGLACLSAALFGAMSVGLRIGLNRYPDVELGTVATVIGALAVALVAAAAEAPARGVHAGQAWPFAAAGLLQPGVGQLLVTIAIREA